MSGEDKRDLDRALRRVENLIGALDTLPDVAAREPARELVELILDLHGLALAKLLSIVVATDGGSTLLARLVEDDHVRSLLLLHGLHPDDVDTRVRRAVERLRPHLGVHGLRLDVVEIAEGVARLKVQPSIGASVKASVLWTLPAEIENAIVEAAPDIVKVVVDGLDMTAPLTTAAAPN